MVNDSVVPEISAMAVPLRLRSANRTAKARPEPNVGRPRHAGRSDKGARPARDGHAARVMLFKVVPYRVSCGPTDGRRQDGALFTLSGACTGSSHDRGHPDAPAGKYLSRQNVWLFAIGFARNDTVRLTTCDFLRGEVPRRDREADRARSGRRRGVVVRPFTVNVTVGRRRVLLGV